MTLDNEKGCIMAERSLPGIDLLEILAEPQRRWFIWLIITNVFYLAFIAGLSTKIMREKRITYPIFHTSPTLEEHRTKDKLYGILRTKGYSLGQGLDIVEAVVSRSRELELPLALIMAVIDEESEFYPNARSSKAAQGLMQIMPSTWDEYVAKLDLKVGRRAMTDPFMNITVGCQILKDLFSKYEHIGDLKVKMAKVLTDYNNGGRAAKPNLKYAIQVNRTLEEYEKELQ